MVPAGLPWGMAHGIYGKDVHFKLAFKPQWDKLIVTDPGLCQDLLEADR